MPGEKQDRAQRRVLIGAIIAAAILIIGLIAARRRRARTERLRGPAYVVGNPAAPRQQTAADRLCTHIGAGVALGQQVAADVAAVSPAGQALLPGGPALPVVVADITRSLDAANRRLRAAPNTYAALLGVYQGLAGSDQKMLRTATALENAGHSVQQAIEREGAVDVAPLGLAGGRLVEMAREIRGVLLRVHRLGVALDVE
jgi:hypothetical protein